MWRMERVAYTLSMHTLTSDFVTREREVSAGRRCRCSGSRKVRRDGLPAAC